MHFSDYLPGLDLEAAVRAQLAATGATEGDTRDIFTLLEPLRMKGDPGVFHRNHSLRVGLVAAAAGEYLAMDARALLFAGLLHDVGKALVPCCVLAETERWTAAEQAAMEPHVLDGFRLLRDRFDFTAAVIAWHHRFQGERSYPRVLPGSSRPFSETTLGKAKTYGRVLALADTYDALHRVNSASGGEVLDEAEVRRRLLALYPDMLLVISAIGERVGRMVPSSLCADGSACGFPDCQDSGCSRRMPAWSGEVKS